MQQSQPTNPDLPPLSPIPTINGNGHANSDSLKINGHTHANGHDAGINGHSYSHRTSGSTYSAFDHLSDRARVTQADGIRALLHAEGPGIVSFVSEFRFVGRPNPQTFPFSSITLNLKPPLFASDRADFGEESLTIEGEDLDDALQYGPSAGLPTLREWLKDFQSVVHHRSREKGDWTISMGSGSQDVMYKGFMAVLNPGDPILLETPIYAGILAAVRNTNAEMIEVDVDDQGLSAIKLEKILASWPAGKKRPKVLYTSPVGSNPSGCSCPKERKLAVLEVCRKYGILIFEDDPYYYLANNLIPSYFELEAQIFSEPGHVVRFDSFSKLLSAGLRLGFATGPIEIIHAIDVLTSSANLHTSSVSSGIALRLLGHWGVDGFLAHGRAVAKFYAKRRAEIEDLAHNYLDGLAEWVSPVAGMFLWIDMSPAGIEDSYQLVTYEALAKGVLGVPGSAFYPSGRKSTHIRLSFSEIGMEDAELGLRRLAEAIREAQAKIRAIKA